MATPGPKPKRIDTRWTAELAYVVGVIASDGNLGRDGMYIDVTSKDKGLLKTVRGILDMKHITIGTKHSGGGHHAYRIQFKRALFHQWLMSIGLTPNKSKTIGRVAIPRQYFFDFLRGAWDGDGTVSRVQDTRWKNSYVVSLGFASGSHVFLTWLQAEINERLRTHGFITSLNRGFQLRYATHDSQKIFAAMFYQPELPHLPRKFAKAQKIFKITARSN